ncbi:MAG: hypothetical protein KDB07_07455 [Planctomycetes bacterium]|nr:hypothetical protein [Planctomycetota bacterium]
MSQSSEPVVTLPTSKRTLHIVDWLPPDFGAVGQYALAWCRGLAGQGQDVTIAGLSSSESSIEEEQHGEGRLRVIRLQTPAVDKKSFAKRMLWMVKTNIRLLWHLRREMKRAHEIVFSGSPPYMLWFIWPIAGRAFGKHLVYRISDFHPECLMAGLKRVPWPLYLLEALTISIRKQINGFEVLGEDMRQRILAQGIENERVCLRRDPSPVSVPAGTEPLPTPDALKGLKILLYSGNFGYAHDDATFVEAYIRHHHEGSGRVGLWLNAGGMKADRVEAALRAAKVPVHRGSTLPIEQLPNLLATPDAHLVTLLDGFVGHVLPSKIYGAIESQKQVLFVGSAASDVELLCLEGLPQGHYHRASVGDVDGVFRALEAIGRQDA